MPVRPVHSLLLATCLAGLCASAAHAHTELSLDTHAARSGFNETGDYAEVAALCRNFEAAYPDAVRCLTFGRSAQDRPMLALAVSRTGALTAQDARAQEIPVVLMQGAIHAGEVDGKDAGFLALSEVLAGNAASGSLDHLVWLFVPVFNVDGHERRGEWNRPNQRGPRETGWRATAQNLNLNRDYAKADSPEMQAMLRLVSAWDPIATIDLHATNGAQFEHDIAIQVEPLHAGDPALRAIGLALREGVIADLAAQGSLPLPFYPSLVTYDDPTSGFEDEVMPPRFSTGYFLLRNRFSMLVETHSWKPYPARVAATRNTIVSVLEHAARHAQAWQQAAHAADARAHDLAGHEVALAHTATDAVRMIDFRGVAYTRTPSPVSGALMTRYDASTPSIWHVPLRDQLAPSVTAIAPGAGYVVPAAHAGWLAERLALHDITFQRLPDALARLPVEVFRATQATPASTTTEGRQRMTLEGAWQAETRDLDAGALFVPIAQPKARLVMALLEPDAPDAYVAWGMFNAHFERKEYMEAYVAEDVAGQMLQDDPALRATFEQRLAQDPAFAQDPRARLDFFYRRHSAWDESHNLYPVLRVHHAPH